ncbi:MAG: hypothetical protein JWN16_369 [Alphaproteobacteria bacterium]|nr:hypothetical protein [Alphaproteobacteria bacterium]
MTASDIRPKAWPIAIQAWKSFGGALLGLLPLVLVTLVLAGALSAAQVAVPKLYAILLRPKAEDIKVVSGLTHVGARLAVILLFSLIVTPLTVAVHRRILAPQAGFLPAARSFFLWLFLLQAAFLAAHAFALLASAVSFVRSLIDLIVDLGAIIVVFRLIFLWSAVAVGEPTKSAETRMDDSWTLSEGRFWLIARTVFFTLLPMAVLLFVTARVVGGPVQKPPPAPVLPPPAVTAVRLIAAGLWGAAMALTFALGASMTSWLSRAVGKKI